MFLHRYFARSRQGQDVSKTRAAPYNIFDPKKSKYALQHENEYKSKGNSGFPKYLQHKENETFEPTEL